MLMQMRRIDLPTYRPAVAAASGGTRRKEEKRKENRTREENEQEAGRERTKSLPHAHCITSHSHTVGGKMQHSVQKEIHESLA